MDAFNIALQGMRSNLSGFAVAAHNVANVNTEGYRSLRYGADTDSVEIRDILRDSPELIEAAGDGPASDVELAREFVDMKQYENGFRANAVVLNAADRMHGALLDVFA